MEIKDKFVYWKCEKCNSYHKSDKIRRHRMDTCKCGESHVDAEEWYSRWMGSPVVVTEEEYNKNKDEKI